MTELIAKLRSFLRDRLKKDTRVFEYSTSNIFELDEDNAQAIIQTLKNGNPLGSGETATLNSETNSVTVVASLVAKDLVQFKYSYYKYSEDELTDFIIIALGWVSLLGACYQDFEVDDEGEVYPAPTTKEEDLICLIAKVIADPNYSMYSTPDLTERFPRTKSKEQKIQDIVNAYRSGDLGLFFAE